MAFNWVDYALLAVFFISILGGLFRGGVKEIMSLLTWIAAFIIASLFAKPLANAFAGSEGTQSVISSASKGALDMSASTQVSLFGLGVSFIVLFFGTIIIGALLGYLANRVVEAGGISIFNRFLGGIFGLVRGYLINLLIVFLVQLTAVAEQPYWTQSSLVRTFQPTVKWLGNKVQPGFESLKSRVGQTLEGIKSGTENSAVGVYQGH